MADIKVERRGTPGWLVAALLALVALALMLALGWWSRPAPVQVGTFDPAREAGLTVQHEGRTWIPADVSQAARFPAEQMTIVGQQGRHTLWANREQGIGGGGGGVQAPERLETGAYHRIYLRLGDGRYLPMVWRAAVPMPSRTDQDPVR